MNKIIDELETAMKEKQTPDKLDADIAAKRTSMARDIFDPRDIASDVILGAVMAAAARAIKKLDKLGFPRDEIRRQIHDTIFSPGGAFDLADEHPSHSAKAQRSAAR